MDPSSLLQRLEKVIREQGDLQEKSLENLRLADRSSLLSEIQALRAQLRMTHLQNQEKLQQLCTALTSAEARGSRQEHQLRRQVELLAYKVEQEKCIASDLQKTLSEEQEKTNDVQKLLVTEQNVVKDLKSELCECKQENERLLKSLDAVQKEVIQLRCSTLMISVPPHDRVSCCSHGPCFLAWMSAVPRQGRCWSTLGSGALALGCGLGGGMLCDA